MKLSNLNKFKGKKVIVEWKDPRPDKGISSANGILEDVEQEGITLTFLTPLGKEGLQKISIEDLALIQEV